MNKRPTLISLGLTTIGALAALGLKTVFAGGIPALMPLYYSGTLTEGGQLVTGTRAITVNLWSDGMVGGSPLCTTVGSTANVVNGRFRIALASSCKAIVNQNNNVYVEVIDGATSLGRSPIGAVPYAVEADHAVNADNATNASNATNATTATTAQTAGGALQTSISQIQSAITALQGQSTLLFGVASPVVTVTNGSQVFTAATCGPTGRIVTGFCVTNPVQPVVPADPPSPGLWKNGPFDANLNNVQTSADPGLGSTWVCDVRAANGVKVQAYAVCMNAPGI
jgi:hypothetical protein